MVWLQLIRDLSILIGTWVAIYGINSWRREHTGKRRLELAEDALVLFYEARDAVRHVRSPFSWSSETEDIQRLENETDKCWQARKKASVVFKRYNDHQELFSKLHAMRYRFMARFGKKEAEPFEEIRKITNEVIVSARMLATLWSEDFFLDNQQRERHFKTVQKHQAVFWEGSQKDDPINPRLDALIDKMEKTCNAIISGSDALCGVFNLNVFRKKP